GLINASGPIRLAHIAGRPDHTPLQRHEDQLNDETEQLVLLLPFLQAALGQSAGCLNCALTNFQYTCVNETSYGFCFSEETVDETTIRSCDEGFYCTLDEFCSPEESSSPACVPDDTTSTTSDVTTESSTESSTVTTDTSTEYSPTTDSSSTESSTVTTESSTETSTATTDSSTISSPSSTDSSTESTTGSPLNADLYCSTLQKKGYFRVDSDSTCKQYVYCYKLSLDYLGWLYYCNTNEFYNSDTESCQAERPANC
ncbi:cell wall integrity and stress response component 2, partial [Drosophila persimilis]|uniref:cell wall integrity and stress response component 2 n=1 Tax=Drosophila persimilis TaxID=7234 RepID=UPI000F08276D